ncbi:GNAT family N-acetyltransferase [Fibrobacterota bacterium]
MKIRSYKKGDEIRIAALDRSLEVHPWNRRDVNNWHWKYSEKNPSSKGLVWIMEDKDELLAHFAAVPYTLKVFDKEIIGSHTIAALVVEKFQGRGLLKFVADKLFEELKEKNIPFSYGFPNERSYSLHLTHMDYIDLIKFDTWKIQKAEITGDQVVKTEGFENLPVFDDKVDTLWEESKDDYQIAVKRDQDYLNWRYLQRPDCTYYPFGLFREGKLAGYTVLKLYQEEDILRGHILDIFAPRTAQDVFDDLIRGSLDFFQSKNVDEATCWIWGNSTVDSILKEKGFEKETTGVPLVIRINRKFQYVKEIVEASNWFFTMGDSTEIF